MNCQKIAELKRVVELQKKLLKFSYLLKVFEDLQQLWEMCERLLKLN